MAQGIEDQAAITIKDYQIEGVPKFNYQITCKEKMRLCVEGKIHKQVPKHRHSRKEHTSTNAGLLLLLLLLFLIT